MKPFAKLSKLKAGDTVGIVSPSFAAPGMWPHMYELGLKRVREVFGLNPIDYPATAKLGASSQERTADLVAAFTDPQVKAVIASLGGDDQVTYVKNISPEPFVQNPKPYFGYSDNTHFMNFLWLNGIPSYYGGSIFTQYAMQNKMDEFTVKYLKLALFEESQEVELTFSPVFNDVGLQWNDPETINMTREYEPNEGWYWDGAAGEAKGITWGGCLESIDEILRHGVATPALEDFDNIILFLETSEEMPDARYVRRVLRALGERGVLARVQGVLVGRPKAWHFGREKTPEEKQVHRAEQRETFVKVIRDYNKTVPIVQNMDFGHTDPQICLPYGGEARIDCTNKKVFVKF
ncbi:LD-carboxypeptidase [bacterium]|nr:MAG: LD-carboxypeptidase [bacterium]